ncbi:MAG: response regulator [Deltaproteobacteria bacterium]|nr:response regulator [Deltaproteobacteria bacterium]
MMPALEKRIGQGILVVDDDPNEMRSLVIGLRLEGFDAVGAASGPDALSTLEQKSFQAVIIDLMMPEMNGLQLARAVRSAHPSTTTILMSAYHLSPVQLARADTGVVGFVPKPFCFEELVHFINSKIDPNGAEMPASISTSVDNGLHAPIDVAAMIADRDSKIPGTNSQRTKRDSSEIIPPK